MQSDRAKAIKDALEARAYFSDPIAGDPQSGMGYGGIHFGNCPLGTKYKYDPATEAELVTHARCQLMGRVLVELNGI